jgi:alpha-ketoglutarate-dependent taurine dioxygenase
MALSMTAQFGLIIDKHPLTFSSIELRTLLSLHGVLIFKNNRLSILQLKDVMSRLGPLQNWDEQQAPKSHSDKDNPMLINLGNSDFLGKSRMAWHTDQTYLTTPYLPIRCLYTPVSPTPGNITSFLDIKPFTELLQQEYPELLQEQAKYYINSDKEEFSIRPIFSHCEHLNMPVFRLDTRMEFIDNNIDVIKFTKLIKEFINTTNKVDVEWSKWDFVIFDNNQCPHRRSEMTGECHLHRLTSTFWLE